MSDTLFDPTPYGEATPVRVRRRREPPEMIRLALPWTLLGHAHKPPTAHLLVARALPNKDGAWPARCGAMGFKFVGSAGAILVPVCRECWKEAHQ